MKHLFFIAAVMTVLAAALPNPAENAPPLELGTCSNPLTEKASLEQEAVCRTLKNFPKMLKEGMRGLAVETLNKKLVEIGCLHNDQGSTFSPETKRAVMAFQFENGLDPDGIVGEKTLYALFGGSL